MDKQLFDDLVCSLKEVKAIAQGNNEPSRRFEAAITDVKAVRENIGLTQNEFASLMRVSIKTLQIWEQNRRTPSGPAAALLKIVSKKPEVVLKSLL